MNEKPLVSVIIPTYKRVKYLERALNSVLNQTYNNIEIIIIDDNDPKSNYRIETSELVNRYMKLHENIIYFKLEKNSGGCIARNKGIELANGKYINFLDDDDLFHEEKIEKQVKRIESHDGKVAVVGCFAQIIDNKGNVKRIEKEEIKGNVFFEQLRKNICTTSLALINREVCLKSGGFIKIPSSQEHLFFIKVFEINPYYDYVDEVLVDINHHLGERVSNNKNKPVGAIKLFEYVEGYFVNLDKGEINEISISHYENIIRAYLAINNRKECIPYFRKIVKSKGMLNKQVIKLFLLITLGFNTIDKIKGRIDIH